jgi:GMP synthase-like glutamine amidotransferase
MKPVLIFRHVAAEGAGYLVEFLDANHIPWQLVKIDAGDKVPESILSFSGMVLMGGPMSVNDDLPWIPPVLNLIRAAVAADIPVLGHCLGGQLISKALGAQVTQNPVKEIGWAEVVVSESMSANTWFGVMQSFNGFHWHGETFALPTGATHLLASQHCQNQAYAIGKHLAFQCHIEMTPDMVVSWCEIGQQEILDASTSPAVQSVQVITENLPLHCFFLNKVANRVYTQWIKGLAN